MRIRADVGVGHPANDVWALLASRSGAKCVPGLTTGPGDVRSLAFDVEARHLIFDGTASAASDGRARTVTVEAKGVERAGLGKARTTVMLRVDDDGLFSSINLEADLHLSGEVASMARLIAEVVYRLADEMAECLDERLGAGARPPAPPPPTPPPESSRSSDQQRTGWVRSLLDRLGGR
jgi:carbon monoxide dehydrogenase subunit G